MLFKTLKLEASSTASSCQTFQVTVDVRKLLQLQLQQATSMVVYGL